jgi:ATP-dependent Clp protease adaptor protein ClpS
MHQSQSAVIEPATYRSPEKARAEGKPKRQPRYHVILWDDSEHTFDYVIRMLQDLFGHTFDRALQLATEVDSAGKAILLTTTREHAELKRDQVKTYGKDILMKRCRGSMRASIQPEA